MSANLLIAYQERYSKPCFRANPARNSTPEEILRHAAVGN